MISERVISERVRVRVRVRVIIERVRVRVRVSEAMSMAMSVCCRWARAHANFSVLMQWDVWDEMYNVDQGWEGEIPFLRLRWRKMRSS